MPFGEAADFSNLSTSDYSEGGTRTHISLLRITIILSVVKFFGASDRHRTCMSVRTVRSERTLATNYSTDA